MSIPIHLTDAEDRELEMGMSVSLVRDLDPQPIRKGGYWEWNVCRWTAQRPHCPLEPFEFPIDYCPYNTVDTVVTQYDGEEPFEVPVFTSDARCVQQEDGKWAWKFTLWKVAVNNT